MLPSPLTRKRCKALRLQKSRASRGPLVYTRRPRLRDGCSLPCRPPPLLLCETQTTVKLGSLVHFLRMFDNCTCNLSRSPTTLQTKKTRYSTSVRKLFSAPYFGSLVNQPLKVQNIVGATLNPPDCGRRRGYKAR